MKVIFLDFDGVLNSAAFFRTCREEGAMFDPKALAYLAEIVAATDAVIVLSTSWRKHWQYEQAKSDSVGQYIHTLFREYAMTVVDKTPCLSMFDRPEEIRQYLKAHPEVEHFVILDDFAFGWEELSEHLVRTHYYLDSGLSAEHRDRAIAILNA
ncbi:MAG: hypothetical protein IJW46_00970 [Clostridia bacterium]|nr:hypothetical protein [Clostridia bacterium]